MFTRSLRTISLNASAFQSLRVALRSSFRAYSKFPNNAKPELEKSNHSNGSNGSSNSNNGSGQKLSPFSKGYVLTALGLLVVGSTDASAVYTKQEPRLAPEPATPAFSDKDISVIFVLGGPGSGKGTQCAKLVKDKGFVHLSAGDLLRAEQVREGSLDGALIAKCIKEGTIVPQEVTVRLLRNAVSENVKKGNFKFLVDGFPRKMDQALTFEEQIVKSSFTLFFECPEQVMLNRLLERGKTSGRADDNIESIKKRFKTFVETSMPVVEYFDKQGKVVKLSCDEPVDVVYGRVKDALVKRGIN